MIATFSNKYLEETTAYFQPQHDLKTGKVCGAEALVRWQHKNLGILGPFHVLSAMHTIELRRSLWDRMLKLSLLMLKKINHTDIQISVNVSADVASSNNWAADVAQTVKQNLICSSNLAVEITEDIGDSHDKGLAEAICKLRRRGFDCAIDDFGIGFSTLKRLSHSSFNILKIDRSYIMAARLNGTAKKVLTDTVNMAKDLGLTVVAEGVEFEEDFDRVSRLGCDIAQGFFFAQPMPADRFTTYIYNA